VVQAMNQDLPEPSDKFSLRLAAELAKIAVGPQHRLLHQIGRAHAATQAGVELRRRQDREVVPVELEQATEMLLFTLPGFRQETIHRITFRRRH